MQQSGKYYTVSILEQAVCQILSCLFKPTKKRPWIGRLLAMERETGFEPATSTLARLHSTPELFPLNFGKGQLSKDQIIVKTK